jgi:hypothetical protein
MAESSPAMTILTEIQFVGLLRGSSLAGLSSRTSQCSAERSGKRNFAADLIEVACGSNSSAIRARVPRNDAALFRKAAKRLEI